MADDVITIDFETTADTTQYQNWIGKKNHIKDEYIIWWCNYNGNRNYCWYISQYHNWTGKQTISTTITSSKLIIATHVNTEITLKLEYSLEIWWMEILDSIIYFMGCTKNIKVPLPNLHDGVLMNESRYRNLLNF